MLCNASCCSIRRSLNILLLKESYIKSQLYLCGLRLFGGLCKKPQYAAAYCEGEVVVPVRDYRRYGLEKNAQYTVTGRDVENNLVTVAGPQGEDITWVHPSFAMSIITHAV